MDKQKAKSIRKTLKRDKRLERLKESFATQSIYNIPFETIKDELKVMHKTRKMPQVSMRSEKFVDSLSKASLHDHSFRSRITEIMVECASVRTTLKRMLDALEDYLLIEYADILSSLRTKDERRTFISTVLDNYSAYLGQVLELEEICRYYIECIDKGGYMARDLVSAYSIERRYEPT